MQPSPLPLSGFIETPQIQRNLVGAHRALGELKGVARLIPNEDILITTLSLQEAVDSSAVENIVTTQDELFRSDAFTEQFTTPAAKEVYRYVAALRLGFERVRKTKLLINNDLLAIQECLEENKAGFRKVSGTVLRNEQTGETIYTPPAPQKIEELMTNLEKFINDDSFGGSLDPLTKMAIIHHQFESIHPFYDGNGRTGRIINILYLVKNDLLDTPSLYLSRYINKNKDKYYHLLQSVRDNNAWEEWIIYILNGVEQTSRQTIRMIHAIRELMQNYKHKLRNSGRKLYSQDLLNSIFRHPYSKISTVQRDLRLGRQAATQKLDMLCSLEINLMTKHRIGRENYYFNNGLIEILTQAGTL